MTINSAEWYSPRDILLFNRLHRSQAQATLSKNERKSIAEAQSVALMAIGLMQLYQLDYKLRIIDLRDQCPDIALGWEDVLSNQPHKLHQREVEVVTQTSHSATLGLAKFLEQTKLARVFAYADSTVILCHIQDSHDTRNWRKAHQDLIPYAGEREIYVLQKAYLHTLIYNLARVTPKYDQLVQFNVLRVLAQQKSLVLAA